jgi:MraZ protein
MKLFLATHIHKVDQKGRVSLPSSFRSAIVNHLEDSVVGYDKSEIAFGLVRSLQSPSLEGMTLSRLEEFTDAIDRMGVFSEDQQDLSAAILGDCKVLNVDNDGRVVLPTQFLEYAKIEGHVAFVGKGKSFEIWHPDLFTQHQEAARQRLLNKKLSVTLGGSK